MNSKPWWSVMTEDEKQAWRLANGRFCNCCHPSHGWCLRTGEGQSEARRTRQLEWEETRMGLLWCAGVAITLATLIIWHFW
jgi:hypothetical protein